MRSRAEAHFCPLPTLLEASSSVGCRPRISGLDRLRRGRNAMNPVGLDESGSRGASGGFQLRSTILADTQERALVGTARDQLVVSSNSWCGTLESTRLILVGCRGGASSASPRMALEHSPWRIAWLQPFIGSAQLMLYEQSSPGTQSWRFGATQPNVRQTETPGTPCCRTQKAKFHLLSGIFTFV